jgi:ubiquinol-cytochrome c reductase cytochrome c subunit
VRLLTARLSARRRSPFAGFAVVLIGLMLSGGLYALVSPAQASESSASADLVAQGRDLFLVGCSSCHGQNGEGVLNADGTQMGPSLVGVGAAAVDFQVGTGRMPAQNPGAQEPQKPVVYTPDEISALAAYVASLGPGPAIPTSDEYDPLAIPADQQNAALVRGGELFRTNCTACHNFAASGGALPGGKYAPSLSGVTPKHMFEAMLTGPQQMPVFSNAVMTPQDKRDIISYIQSIQSSPQYGGSYLGSIGPVSEGLFAWVFGLGACVTFAIWIAAHTARSSKGSQA